MYFGEVYAEDKTDWGGILVLEESCFFFFNAYLNKLLFVAICLTTFKDIWKIYIKKRCGLSNPTTSSLKETSPIFKFVKFNRKVVIFFL